MSLFAQYQIRCVHHENKELSLSPHLYACCSRLKKISSERQKEISSRTAPAKAKTNTFWNNRLPLQSVDSLRFTCWWCSPLCTASFFPYIMWCSSNSRGKQVESTSNTIKANFQKKARRRLPLLLFLKPYFIIIFCIQHVAEEFHGGTTCLLFLRASPVLFPLLGCWS